MLDDLYRIWMATVFVLEVLCLLALVIGLLWLRYSRNRLRTGAGGRGPVVIAGALVAATILGALGLALIGAKGVPWMVDLMERQNAARQEQAALQAALIDQPAPHLHFTGVTDERTYHLDEFAGEVVLVNFWGTWCGPCRKEMPHLEQLQLDLGSRGLRVIHLSYEPLEEVAQYVREEQPANLHVWAEASQWPAAVLPTSYVVDREGVIRHVRIGYSSYDIFVSLVEPHL